MGDFEVLKMLFEIHQQQLENRRRAIHEVTERTMAFLIVIAGWVVITSTPLSTELKWAIIIAVVIISIAACFLLLRHNRDYFRIACVVRKINESLGLYEPNKYYPNEPLYPEVWKVFGEVGRFRGLFTHWSMIIAGAIFCIILTLAKA